VGDLPWSITAHFRAFPAKVLIRCKDLETVKHQFQNNLKEVRTVVRRCLEAASLSRSLA